MSEQNFKIVQLDSEQLTRLVPGLVTMLQNVVDNGASIGFWPPLAADEAQRYWEGLVPGVTQGNRILLVLEANSQLAGSVQLELIMKPNGSHRAEVQKLMVHTDFRNRGFGRALLTAIENIAREKNRRLLILDTRTGDSAEKLYQTQGYTKLGDVPGYVIEVDGTYSSTTYYYRDLKA